MSVLKNKRHTSRFEYEHHFATFYKDIIPTLEKVSKRRRTFISDPLKYATENAYLSIIKVNQHRYSKQPLKKQVKEYEILKAIDDVWNIQKPLIVMSCAERIPFKKQVRLCEALNEEIRLLNELLMNKNETPSFVAIDWSAVSEAKFLNKMCELHRYTHSKIIRGVDKLRRYDANILCDFIDEALYEIVTANTIYPTCYEEYLIRRDKFEKAVQRLKDMSVPLLSYFNLMNYEEWQMREWCEMINEEIKMLEGIIKSDTKRFSRLNKKDK